MKYSFTLGVLDQVPVRYNDTASQALNESVDLAICCEKWGYQRYWVAEHHHSYTFASTNPDILVGQIAARTKVIRVGSGGVMLLNHSALQVAERFKLLEAFYSGRIDLGVGKSRGTDEFGSKAISYPHLPHNIEIFDEQIFHLLDYLTSKLEPSHPFSNFILQPGLPTSTNLQIWMLGLSAQSASLAGKMGIKYSIAHFLSNDKEYALNPSKVYKECFVPSGFAREPETSIAVEVMCASTEKEAKILSSTRNLYKAVSKLELEDFNGLLPPDKALPLLQNPDIAFHAQKYAERCIDGTPTEVKRKIVDLAEHYQADHVLVLTNCYSFAARKRSYELIANEFDLSRY